MNKLINDLSKLVPDVEIRPGDSFYWSPEKNLIVYNEKLANKPAGLWALFHEIAHATLNHTNYSSDLGLLRLEVEAWDEAKKLGKKFQSEIDEDHIQDCLDTYRDWLHRRSTCPTCEVICIQNTPTNYNCHNCQTNWAVSASRFCRPYRLKLNEIKEKRSQVNVATFS
jgi:hypothetical protein